MPVEDVINIPLVFVEVIMCFKRETFDYHTAVTPHINQWTSHKKEIWAFQVFHHISQ